MFFGPQRFKQISYDPRVSDHCVSHLVGFCVKKVTFLVRWLDCDASHLIIFLGYFW